MTFPFPRNRVLSLRLHFCDRGPQIGIIMTSCSSSWNFSPLKVSNTYRTGLIIRVNCHFLLLHSLCGLRFSDQDRTTASQFDAEFQKLIRESQNDYLIKDIQAYTICHLLFWMANTDRCWITSVLKAAALSGFYYEMFMLCDPEYLQPHFGTAFL